MLAADDAEALWSIEVTSRYDPMTKRAIGVGGGGGDDDDAVVVVDVLEDDVYGGSSMRLSVQVEAEPSSELCEGASSRAKFRKCTRRPNLFVDTVN